MLELDKSSAGRRGPLQDLRVKLGFAEIEEELIERGAVEPLGIEQVAGVKGPAFAVSEVVHRALEAFPRHGQIFPAALVPQPANEHVYINFHLHPNRPPGKGARSVIIDSFTYSGP